MEENVKEYKIEGKRMAYIIIKDGKLTFIKGEFKDENGQFYSLEFFRWQVKHYLKNHSDFTHQVREVFKYFVKMAGVFKPEYLCQVYGSLKENDVEMFNVLKESIAEVKDELFNQYL